MNRIGASAAGLTRLALSARPPAPPDSGTSTPAGRPRCVGGKHGKQGAPHHNEEPHIDKGDNASGDEYRNDSHRDDLPPQLRSIRLSKSRSPCANSRQGPWPSCGGAGVPFTGTRQTPDHLYGGPSRAAYKAGLTRPKGRSDRPNLRADRIGPPDRKRPPDRIRPPVQAGPGAQPPAEQAGLRVPNRPGYASPEDSSSAPSPGDRSPPP